MNAQIIVKSATTPRLTPIARELVMKELGVNSLSFQPRALKSGVFMVNDPVVCKVIEDLGLQKSLVCFHPEEPAPIVMQRIVINACFGGFGLSQLALEYMHRFDSQYVNRVEYKYGKQSGFYFELTVDRDDRQFRQDRLLIEAVETLGAAADGEHGKPKVIEIPADVQDWYIDEYDGVESVREGRIWR